MTLAVLLVCCGADRKYNWSSRWWTTTESVRRTRSVASSSAVTRRVRSCVTGVTCWRTRGVLLRNGTSSRSCQRKTNGTICISPVRHRNRWVQGFYDSCGRSDLSPLPFKRNRLRCVRCVNENRKKRKRLRWQAANHGCHCFDWLSIPIGWRLPLLRGIFTQKTQAPANRNARSKQWQP